MEQLLRGLSKPESKKLTVVLLARLLISFVAGIGFWMIASLAGAAGIDTYRISIVPFVLVIVMWVVSVISYLESIYKLGRK